MHPLKLQRFLDVDVFCSVLINNAIYFELYYRVFWSTLTYLDKVDFFNLHDVDLSAVIKIQAWGGVRLRSILDKIHNKVIEITYEDH